MKNKIPQIKFNPEQGDNFGFEIVPLQKLNLNKAEFEHSPELPHQLEFYNLIFISNGSGQQFIDFKWYPINGNSLVYLTKDQVTAFDFSGSLEGFCIIFTEEHFINCFSSLSQDFVFRSFNPQLYSPVLQIPKNSDFEDYFNLLHKEFLNTDSFNQKTIIESLFIILISKAESIQQNQPGILKESPKNSVFQKFINLIQLHLTKSRSAEFYATLLSVTYKHLNSICRGILNKTAKNVIDDFVILQAKRNLINTSIKSTQLAYQLGFEDPTNFTKYFKKHTGLTPKAFRKSIYNN